MTFRLPAGAYQFRANFLGHTFWSEPASLAAQAVQPVEIAAGGGTFGFTLLKSPTEPLAGVKCYLFDAAAEHYPRGMRKKQLYQSCLSLNPFSVYLKWAQTMSMHPFQIHRKRIQIRRNIGIFVSSCRVQKFIRIQQSEKPQNLKRKGRKIHPKNKKWKIETAFEWAIKHQTVMLTNIL